MSPVILECQRRGLPFFIIHSKQHYSEKLDSIFFEELQLPLPKYNLNAGSGGHANQTGRILIEIEPILESEKPDLLLVQGDTNTVVAGALAAQKMQIKIGHIEAGLRSFDKTMPEESNRIIADHISDFLFAVTDIQVDILKHEGIPDEKIFKVGNTIVDALLRNIAVASGKSRIVSELQLQPKEYYLFTAHRGSNVDEDQSLKEVVGLIESIPGKVVWPLHYRTQKRLNQTGLIPPGNAVIIEPLGYWDFLALLDQCKKVITDSGGVQEEACILGVPCITIRANTERPETVKIGANDVVYHDREKLLAAIHKNASKWENPFGDGHTAQRILDIVMPKSLHSKSLFPETVSVIGLGYMGLPTALLLATNGVKVNGIDINEKKVESIRSGKCPFDERGMESLLKEALETGLFNVTTELKRSDIYIVAVPTPHVDRRCDLTYVLQAVSDLLPVLKNGDLLIIESTIKPGTCSNQIMPMLEKAGIDVEVAHCPERAIPGNTLHEILHNDRIVGGSASAVTRAKALYSTFVRGKLHEADLITAECAKLMENTYRDVNIALANEFSIVAEELGFDVFKAIRLANLHPRVSILNPGVGVGGHCIAIDPWFLIEDVKKSTLIRASRELNDSMPRRTVDRIESKIPKGTKRLGLLGVSYKPNVDDARETPALKVARALLEKKYEVRCQDPYVKEWDLPLFPLENVEQWAEVLIVLSEHDVYNNLTSHLPILHLRDILNPSTL